MTPAPSTRSSSALACLLRCSPQPAAVHERDGRILMANERYGRLLGCEPSSLVDLPVDALVHPADLARTRSTLHAVATGRGAAEPTAIRLAHAAGSWVDTECLAANLLDEPSIQAVLVTAWDAEPSGLGAARIDRARGLADGIDAGHVGAVFQPIVCLAHGLTYGSEALARWRTPGRVERAPSDFLPLAESVGLMGALGEALLERVAASMQQAGLPARVSVNLSASQLVDTRLVASVANALERHHLPGSSLAFEVAETITVRDMAAAAAMLRDLRALGCGVGIDDLGAGCAALAQLQRMPVDFVKIDRRHIDAMLQDTSAFAVVSALINVARDRGVTTIAQGVERVAQADWLRELGCDLAQGYHFGAPRDWLTLPTPHACRAG